MALLCRPYYCDLAVLVLAHATDAGMLDWAARRAHTRLLLWDEYAECLAKLLTAAQHESQNIICCKFPE